MIDCGFTTYNTVIQQQIRNYAKIYETPKMICVINNKGRCLPNAPIGTHVIAPYHEVVLTTEVFN